MQDPNFRRRRPSKHAGQARPGQDFVAPRTPARNFPEVGMTLRSYGATGRSMPVSARVTPANPQSDIQNPLFPADRSTAEPTRRTFDPPVKPKKHFKRLRHWFRWLSWKKILLFIFLIGLVVGGWLGFKFIYNAHKIFGGSIFDVLHTTKLQGEDTGRVNILLAGNSADDFGHQGGELTDSIMLMSLDTKNNTAFLMSIPRDLWVDIPDGSGDSTHGKINSAYVMGEKYHFNESGYPEGGMGLLEEVVEEDFGIPINYYALINYNAFKDTVDAVGGITVNIKSSDPRGLYDPNIDYSTHGPLVKLTNGEHILTGQQALDLARARGDSSRSYGFAQSDFTRTQNQRMMLVALKDKAASAGVLANPAKLSSLSDALGNNVKTDFKLDEVRRLFSLVKGIDSNQIQSLSLNSAGGKNLLDNYQAANGQSALIPALGLDNYEDIQDFIKQQTSTNLMVREGATVVVLNGTDTQGLANQQRNKLKAKDISVDSVGDADANQATTTIIDASEGKKPNTLAALKSFYGNTTTVTTTNPYKGRYTADFIVIVGADRIPKSTTTTSN